MLKSENFNEDRNLRILDLEIDRHSGTVFLHGEVLDLPDLSYRLLLTLAERAPALVSKDELISIVWNDVVVSDEALMQRVKLLRQAIGDDGQQPRYIASVRGRGYRLIAPIQSQAAKSTPPRIGKKSIAMMLALALAGAALLSYLRLNQDVDPPIPKLAVLPFDDLSEDGSYGYFADGIHEELLARLSELSGVQVVSRTSTRQFRNTQSDVPTIARLLGATDVIEGSVRVSGDDVRITVQLIDAATDEHTWTQSFNRKLTVSNLFEIQDAVAARVAGALGSGVSQPVPDARELPTTSTEAYDLYLLGRWHTYRLTPDQLDLASEFLQQAVALDPEFAEAWATLASAYSFLGSRSGGAAPHDTYPLARQAALRALELDDSLDFAHAAYANILTWYDWDFERAEAEYQRAKALNPNLVLGYALLLSIQHRHAEAIELMNGLLTTLPIDDWAKVNLGWRLLHAERFEEAVSELAGLSSHADAAIIRGSALSALGRTQDAAAEFESELRRRGRTPTLLANLAATRFLAGQLAEGNALLHELEAMTAETYLSPAGLAMVHFAAGNRDRAYELLDTAIEQRDRGAIFLGVNPYFRNERTEPRFQRLLTRIGLPTP